MKKCSKCSILKELNCFQKNKNHSDGLKYQCKECCSKEFQEWLIENPNYMKKRNKRLYSENFEFHRNRLDKWTNENQDKIRNNDLMRQYGITLVKFNEMLLIQNNLCKICKKPEIRLNTKGKVRSLCVDHDHKTGKVRGLLCCKCNRGLGAFNDNIESMQHAIDYLNENN